MSLLFCDSFDHYAALSQKYDSVLTPANLSVVASAARNGAGGLKLAGSSGAVLKNIANTATLFFGFAVNVNVAPSGVSGQLCGFLDGGTFQVDLRMDSGGHLIFTRGNGAATLGTSTSALSFGTWHYIEVKVTIDGTVGVAEVKVDGVFFLQLSGLNTKQTTNAFAGQVQLGSQNTLGASTVLFFDDVYLLNTSGSVNNTYLGDLRVTMALPSANGTLNNYTNAWAAWAVSTVMAVGQQIKDSNNNIQEVQSITSDFKTGTVAPTWATTGGTTTVDNHVTWVVRGAGANPGAANWMAVSENPPDDNNSYVTDATVSDQDRYTFPAIAASQVFAVVVNMRAEKDDAAVRTIRAVTKSGATTADNGSDFALTQNSYADFQGIFETDPNTSAAWTQAGVNAAEFGVKTTA